jgi:hypothetical protein
LSKRSSPKLQLPRQIQANHLIKLLLAAGVGRRPVVFVCHSQGGLLIKELLTNLHTSHLLLQATKGVVFLGTPHLGSPHAQYAPETMHTILYNPSLPFKQLIPGPELLELNVKWCKLINDTKVLSYSLGESLPTTVAKGVSAFIVPEVYSNPKCGNFSLMQLADHVNINKPSSREDIKYITLVNTLSAIIRNSGE